MLLNLFKNKSLLSFIMLFLITSCYSDVSVDSKPINHMSATNLAKEIADLANCGSFEDNSFQKHTVFTCQMIINGKDEMFYIHVFYEKTEMDKMLEELKSTEKLALVKVGDYYIVSKSVVFGIRITAQDYVNFPGEIINTSK